MTAEPFGELRGRAACLRSDDVDTDQIIPARFLTTTSRAGLGRHLFADWRFDGDGRPRADCPLNAPEAVGARILVAGRNFGCGSSREHAPWALADWGFRAVIAKSFADIFRSNAHRNGLLTVPLPDEAHAALLRALDLLPGQDVHVSLRRLIVTVGNSFLARFEVDAFDRRCLLDGVDELGYLLAQRDAISAYERTMAPLVSTNLPLSRAAPT